jgi:hypothetical protein
LRNQVFVTDRKGDFVSLSQSDSTKVFVFTSQGKTISIDNQLNVTNTIDYEDLRICYLRTKDYKFFTKDKQTIIVNHEDKRIAEIEATSDAFLIENILSTSKIRVVWRLI